MPAGRPATDRVEVFLTSSSSSSSTFFFAECFSDDESVARFAIVGLFCSPIKSRFRVLLLVDRRKIGKRENARTQKFSLTRRISAALCILYFYKCCWHFLYGGICATSTVFEVRLWLDSLALHCKCMVRSLRMETEIKPLFIPTRTVSLPGLYGPKPYSKLFLALNIRSDSIRGRMCS